MSALEQISARLQAVLPSVPRHHLVVRVGYAAELSICAQTEGKQLPAVIHGVKVERTTQFKGWEVYRRGRELE